MTHRKRAFTLVELLTVVAILGLLIMMVMPALGYARHYARTVVCASNLRQITTVMVGYSSQWNGAIVGSVYSSGSRLVDPQTMAPDPNYSNANCPGVVQGFDWMSPVADMMGVPFDSGADTTARVNRFIAMTKVKVFTCPENDVLATTFTGSGGPNAPVHLMPSYNTSLCFQTVQGTGTNDYYSKLNFSGLNLGTYRPFLGQVGNGAEKIFIADGGRWYNGSGSNVTTNLSYLSTGSPGGSYAEYGPWSAYTRAYQRIGLDGRTFSMRHGLRDRGRVTPAFRMNVACFDGHVELLDGMQASDPSRWVPSGTTINRSEAAGNTDVLNKYFPTTVITAR
ncbi:MAG: type II secretion system protein [Phycisphaerae bacterium]